MSMQRKALALMSDIIPNVAGNRVSFGANYAANSGTP
jgi:hypothetical protein